MSGRTLEWYGGALLRRRLLVLVCTCAGLVAGVALAWAEPVVHRSTAVVVAMPQPPPGSGREGLRRAPTVDSDARLLTSDRVLSVAAESVDYPGGLAELRDDVDVTARATSRVLRVRVTHTSAETAQAAADAVAVAFLEARTRSDDVRFQAVRAGLGEQITRLTQQLAAAGAASPLPEGEDLQVLALQEELTGLQRQLVSTRAGAETSGFVAEPAQLSEAGVRPHATSTVVSAALLGLAVGAVAATAAARRDDRATEVGA